jgi:hypothetical protein
MVLLRRLGTRGPCRLYRPLASTAAGRYHSETEGEEGDYNGILFSKIIHFHSVVITSISSTVKEQRCIDGATVINVHTVYTRRYLIQNMPQVCITIRKASLKIIHETQNPILLLS